MKVESIKKVVKITVILSEYDAEQLKRLVGGHHLPLCTSMRDLYNGLTIALRKTNG